MCSTSVKVHTLHKCEQKHRIETLIAFPDTLILETIWFEGRRRIDVSRRRS